MGKNHMKILYLQDEFLICRDDIKGICVLAARKIYKGENIYNCPVVTIPFDDVKEESNLTQYLMDWSEEENCLSFGIINLLNHSDDPNVVLRKDFKDKLMTAYALKDINSCDELTIKYKCEIWFEKV